LSLLSVIYIAMYVQEEDSLASQGQGDG